MGELRLAACALGIAVSNTLMPRGALQLHEQERYLGQRLLPPSQNLRVGDGVGQRHGHMRRPRPDHLVATRLTQWQAGIQGIYWQKAELLRSF